MCVYNVIQVYEPSLQLSKGYIENVDIYRLKRIPHISLHLVWTGGLISTEGESITDDSGAPVSQPPTVLSYTLMVEGTIEPHVCTSLHLYLHK